MIVLFGTIGVIFITLGWIFAGGAGLFVGFILGIALLLVGIAYPDRLLLYLYRAVLCKDTKANKLLAKVAYEAKLPTPQLYLIPSTVMNAFAIGPTRRKASVVITTGLLRLEDKELHAVLAHELAHIRNNDTISHAAVALLAGTLTSLINTAYQRLGYPSRLTQATAGVIVGVLSPIAAFLVRMTADMNREFRADLVGSLWTKKPEAMASALRKISTASREAPVQRISATAPLWIVSPFATNWVNSLFETHPAIEKRIERLELTRSIA